jgi:hypothetical protein
MKEKDNEQVSPSSANAVFAAVLRDKFKEETGIAPVFANRIPYMDYINWLESRLIKQPAIRFGIDFFEFAFLVEACIPPRPIARSMFWQEVIDKYYHVLTENERVRLFEWITTNSFFDLKNEDCRLFYARFNPANQYELEIEFEGKRETIKCFKWNDRFHRDKQTSIVEKYIVNVKWLSSGC